MTTIVFIPAGGLGPRQPEIQQMEPGLASMQALVGGYVQTVPLSPGVDLWINEEGLLKGLPANRLITDDEGCEWPIVGDCFVAASSEEGETVSLTDEQAAEWLQRATDAPVAVHLGR